METSSNPLFITIAYYASIISKSSPTAPLKVNPFLVLPLVLGKAPVPMGIMPDFSHMSLHWTISLTCIVSMASPVLSKEQRKELLEKTVKMVEQIGYEGAGTVEFIYENGKFYFLEINTRVQVEHPDTEVQTGIEIVK